MFKIFFLLGACSAARISRQFVNVGYAPGVPFQPAYYPNYLLHNIFQVDPNRPIPTGITFDGRPNVSQVQSSFHYFSTPLFDYRIHLSPLIPNYQPFIPSYIPTKPPPQRPPFEDDGIEKLDQKLDPSIPADMNGENQPANDDDSVTIDAL